MYVTMKYNIVDPIWNYERITVLILHFTFVQGDVKLYSAYKV